MKSRRPPLDSFRRQAREFWKQLRRLFGPKDPQDPYAYVTAPRKPRRPNRSAAVAEEEP